MRSGQPLPLALVDVERDPNLPAYRWLYAALRTEILSGRLRTGVRLPSTRELASGLGLSRGTIVNAFELLESEGYLRGTIGAGTYVSDVLPEQLLETGRPATRHKKDRPRRTLSRYAARLEPFSSFELRPTTAFRAHIPALQLFPRALWAKLHARRVREGSEQLLLGCDPLGYRPLREAIADHLSSSRGVNCRAANVAIVSGTQESFDIVARLLLDRGSIACMEEPGYRGARIAFASAGATVRGIAVDGEGMEIDRKRLRGARVVFVTPSHQFPLGTTMSLRRRLALLEWARANDASILEDDYDGEYRYAGRPIPCLQGLDTAQRVIFAGTFNKVLFPALRMGFMVVPDDLVGHVEAVKSVTQRHAPVLDQAVVCDFITQGHFGRHLRRMREVYAGRLGLLLALVSSRLHGALELSPVEAGLQSYARICNGRDAKTVVRAAAERNVELLAVADAGLVFGFGAVDDAEIRRGVRELERVFASMKV